MNTLEVVKLSQNAIIPTRGSANSAGLDLYSPRNYEIPPQSTILIETDLQIRAPINCYARIAERSGLALKKQIAVRGGVIDRDYTGNVGVILFNHRKKGDRIAQLICEVIVSPVLVVRESLEMTDRGVNGFGSTGK